jgi:hypothetical protein
LGLFYDVSRSAVSLTAGNDVLSFAGNATRSYRIVSVSITGLGTASAANEFGFFRVGTVGVTPGGTVTAGPKNLSAGAFGGTISTTWGTQPVVGQALIRFGVNANGGVYSKTFTDGEKIDASGGGVAVTASSISLRCISGTSTVSVNVTIEEF